MKIFLKYNLMYILLFVLLLSVSSCKTSGNGNKALDKTEDSSKEQQPSVEDNGDSDYVYVIPSVDAPKNPELDELEIVYGGSMNSVQFDNLQDLYDYVDLVVVATPQETYTEAEQFWSDPYNNRVEEFEDATISHSYTLRNCKINKVYKSKDDNIKEFYLYERAMSDGEKVIMLNGEFIMQKNKKYLMFLYESPVTPGLYLPVIYQGKYDTEADNSKNSNIDQGLLKEVKEQYKEDFKN